MKSLAWKNSLNNSDSSKKSSEIIIKSRGFFYCNINYLTCDDVEDVCSELKTMVIDMKDSLIFGDIIIDTFYSGEALLENIEESPYDLIFLDIELGGDKRGRGRTYYS